jgi:acetylornithine aminotransferase
MTEPLMQQADRVIAATYSRFPILIERGQGCTLWDTKGRSYTDFVAGIAVCNLGHAHPDVAAVIAAQAQKLIHVSNLYYTLPQVELAEFLVSHCFADRVFFANSGAEANEAAIKLARKYSHDQGHSNRYTIISAEKSFHGRTMASLSATGQDKIKKGFDPTLAGFDFVPFNDIEALTRRMDDSICAVMLEPIQGEGGVNCPDGDYLSKVRQLCDRAGVLLIFDEIQTGIGRTGKLFAYEHYGIEPDIMTLAKALANGLPIGAMLAKESVAAAFGPGAHATTFGGTPIVTAGALKTLEIIISENMPARVAEIGAYFKERLNWLKNRHAAVEEVRGIGLLLGIKVQGDGATMVKQCMKEGFLVNCIQNNILRFVPPLIIDKKAIDALIDCLDGILAH